MQKVLIVKEKIELHKLQVVFSLRSLMMRT